MLLFLIFTIFLSLKSVYIINIVTSTSLVRMLYLFHIFSLSMLEIKPRTMYTLSMHCTTGLQALQLHPQTFFIYFWHSPCSPALCWSQIPRSETSSSCFKFPGGRDGRCMPVCYFHLFTFNAHIFTVQIGSFNIMKLTTFSLSEVCLLLQCTN
jgi:hypothetical protein